MASIAIPDLNTPGLDLFQDSESFLNELTEDELNMTRGGITPFIPYAIASSEPCAILVVVAVDRITQEL